MRGRNTRRHQASCEQRKFAVHSGRAVPRRSAAAWLFKEKKKFVGLG